MARYVDDLKVATCLFKAAAWHKAVKVTCVCGHFAVFDPHGLFWRYYRKGWSDDLRDVGGKMWCRICRASSGRKVRPRGIDLLSLYQGTRITLPLPDEREWKRLVNRYRG
ncbi:hypothetical protein [Sphingobium cupriresistens]|uniref:hypothetical protein n=1 Tax=Sphingobium cupriresistens TaxID=1132417 RepID=UPI0009E71EDD|nr:hypothetical protein [Sphingobium cupriresistens]